VIIMMRKLTATGLATLAVAGFAGTGAAFAASSQAAKPAAVAVCLDKPSRDTQVRERASSDTSSKERSTTDRSHDTHSTDRPNDAGDSAR
jgi:hypothetical protein